MSISITRSLLIIGVVAAITFFTRAIPFLLFPKEKAIPKIVQYLGFVLPSAVIGMLVIYCLKMVKVIQYPYGIPEIFSVIMVVALHRWKRNNLLSIGVSTVLYMVLIQAVF